MIDAIIGNRDCLKDFSARSLKNLEQSGNILWCELLGRCEESFLLDQSDFEKLRGLFDAWQASKKMPDKDAYRDYYARFVHYDHGLAYLERGLENGPERTYLVEMIAEHKSYVAHTVEKQND